MEAYETGIRIFEEDTPSDFESAITTGSSTTTTGVLLRKQKSMPLNKVVEAYRYPVLQSFCRNLIRFPIPCFYLKLY